MAIINLRKYYYPIYTKDTFMEVPDEVADVLEEGRRAEHRQDGKRTYYHVYSIDQTPAIENHAMFLVLSPEELMIQAEDEATADLMLARLSDALLLLSPHPGAAAPRPVCAEEEIPGDRGGRGCERKLCHRVCQQRHSEAAKVFHQKRLDAEGGLIPHGQIAGSAKG